MADGPEPLCFTCGLPAGKSARFNHLPNGQVCPSCRDRLLATLPAPFPVGFARGPQPVRRDDDESESYEEPPGRRARPAGELVHMPRPTTRDRGPEPA